MFHVKLTFDALAYRALWELDCQTGFKALRTPRVRVPSTPSIPTWHQWSSALRVDHPLRAPRPRASVRDAPDDTHHEWHLEPSTGKRWPADQHWSRARSAEAGDLRLTWETNRFGHVWDWVTAVSHDEARRGELALKFGEQLRSWREDNPFRTGVNWANGQELAVRTMAWLAGAYAFGPHFSIAQWRDFVELLYQHGVHIEAELNFARRAVANNHLLAEALALAQLADVFPKWRKAKRWRDKGLRLFREAVDEQFFLDGGYCQHSHSYHHFALEFVLDAHAWFPSLRPQLTAVIERSERYFSALIQHGRVPLHGPNDRLDSPDFAVLLYALRDVSRAERGDAPHLRPLKSCASFDDAGLHVLRDGLWMAALRAGELPDRAGHEDGLHLEVWAGPHPIAVDAGSYRYGGRDHAWFSGARSHNVCSSGSTPPRELLSTFTWDRVAHATLALFDPQRLFMRGVYNAYTDMRWVREVELRDGSCNVSDLLDPTGPDAPDLQRIHWLLDAHPQDVIVAAVHDFTWKLDTPRATIAISVTAVSGHLSRPQLRIEPGWISHHYGSRRLITSIELSAVCPAVRFRTTFTPR